MDTKSNNSNKSKEYIFCRKCGSKNSRNSKFCFSCGEKIVLTQKTKKDSPAFQPVRDEKVGQDTVSSEDTNKGAKPAFPEVETPVEKPPADEKVVTEEKVIPVTAMKYVEPSNVFAEGLPNWSVEPPHVMVRRK